MEKEPLADGRVGSGDLISFSKKLMKNRRLQISTGLGYLSALSGDLLSLMADRGDCTMVPCLRAHRPQPQP